jgi:flagellar motor switch protein FliN/FliY
MSQEIELEQLHDDTEAFPAAVSLAPAVGDLRRLSGVPVDLSVEMGRARMTVGEALELRQGSIITLDRMTGEPMDLLVNGTPIARGEIVVVGEQFGLCITAVIGEPTAVVAPGAFAEAEGPADTEGPAEAAAA